MSSLLANRKNNLVYVILINKHIVNAIELLHRTFAQDFACILILSAAQAAPSFIFDVCALACLGGL